jgi:hypothetical protein
MLEVLLLIYLCKQIGDIVRDKGCTAGWYQLMLVLMWIGGEVVGMFCGIVTTGKPGGAAYLFALGGAAAGAIAAFVIARSIAPAYVNRPGFPVMNVSEFVSE